jgi:ribosomal protein S18 acetylase RimI-like enzyme
MMDGLHFHHDEDEDRTTFTLTLGEDMVGSITIEHVFDGYRDFEEYMSDDEYYELFGDDDFYKIEHVEISDEFKGQGYGKLLVQKAIDFVKSREGRTIYLNASPMGFSGLDIGNLVAFYEKFGFRKIPQLDKWDNNKEMILRLKQIG